MSKSLLSSFDDEYKRLEFNTDFYKDIPDDVKQKLYEYVILKKPLDTFLTGICTNNLQMTLHGSETYSLRQHLLDELPDNQTNELGEVFVGNKDKFIRKIFLWFWNVCPSNMCGLENYQEFERNYINEKASEYI